jgi:hypothetical protein
MYDYGLVRQYDGESSTTVALKLGWSTATVGGYGTVRGSSEGKASKHPKVWTPDMLDPILT